jgi:hypothetical protein
MKNTHLLLWNWNDQSKILKAIELWRTCIKSKPSFLEVASTTTCWWSSIIQSMCSRIYIYFKINKVRSIMLVCNWLHFVGQNNFHIMMLLYISVILRSLFIQSYGSKSFWTDSKLEKSDPLHPLGQRDIPSGRSTIQASSVWTTRTFRPNLPLCQEPSNCSSFHLSNFSNKTLIGWRL